jgi:hypothetical protein
VLRLFVPGNQPACIVQASVYGTVTVAEYGLQPVQSSSLSFKSGTPGYADTGVVFHFGRRKQRTGMIDTSRPIARS